jgi:hypothetical protein
MCFHFFSCDFQVNLQVQQAKCQTDKFWASTPQLITEPQTIYIGHFKSGVVMMRAHDLVVWYRWYRVSVNAIWVCLPVSQVWVGIGGLLNLLIHHDDS